MNERQKQIEKQKKEKAYIIAGSVAFIIVCICLSDDKPSRSTFSSSSSGPVIASGGAPAAINEKVYDRLATLAAAHDTLGIDRLINSGLAAHISAGTSVRIIDRGFLTTEIKVESGPYSGQYFIVTSSKVID